MRKICEWLWSDGTHVDWTETVELNGFNGFQKPKSYLSRRGNQVARLNVVNDHLLSQKKTIVFIFCSSTVDTVIIVAGLTVFIRLNNSTRNSAEHHFTFDFFSLLYLDTVWLHHQWHLFFFFALALAPDAVLCSSVHLVINASYSVLWSKLRLSQGLLCCHNSLQTPQSASWLFMELKWLLSWLRIHFAIVYWVTNLLNRVLLHLCVTYCTFYESHII